METEEKLPKFELNQNKWVEISEIALVPLMISASHKWQMWTHFVHCIDLWFILIDALNFILLTYWLRKSDTSTIVLRVLICYSDAGLFHAISLEHRIQLENMWNRRISDGI